MPTSPSLIRPRSDRAAAFWWLADKLRTHPDLRHVVQNWYVPDGDMDFNNPLPADGVSVRLMPTYEPQGQPYPTVLMGPDYISVCSPVLVQITTRVPGVHGDSSINLCEQIEQTAWYLNASDKQSMYDAGITAIEYVTPAASAMTAAPEAQGSIRLIVFTCRPTPI